MVQLLGHLPVHGVDGGYLVLHAHLFPDCTERDAYYERGLPLSRNSESGVVCGCVRSLGYEPRSRPSSQ